jgi:hypothetical protein
VRIFSLALVAAEFLAIFAKMLQNISGTHAATWQQKRAADFPPLQQMSLFTNKLL